MLLQSARYPKYDPLIFYKSIAIIILLAISSIAVAHPEVEERIRRIDAQLSSNKNSAELLSQRAFLYLEHNELDKAKADFNQALQINPKLSVALYGKARLLEIQNKPEEALKILDADLITSDENQHILNFRVELLIKTNRKIEALSIYDKLILKFPEASPDLYLKRANLSEELGDLPSAIAGLNQGIKNLSSIPILIQRALELEEKNGQIEEALIRINNQLLSNGRKDEWYLKKCNLLLRQGRTKEAILSAKSGIEFIKTLPSRTQQLPSVVRTNQELNHILRLTGNS